MSLLSHAATVARRLPIDVRDDNDNDRQRGPLWPHRMGPTSVKRMFSTECPCYVRQMKMHAGCICALTSGRNRGTTPTTASFIRRLRAWWNQQILVNSDCALCTGAVPVANESRLSQTGRSTLMCCTQRRALSNWCDNLAAVERSWQRLRLSTCRGETSESIKLARFKIWDKVPDGSAGNFGDSWVNSEHIVEYVEGCICAENQFDMLNRFDTIPALNGQTDT